MHLHWNFETTIDLVQELFNVAVSVWMILMTRRVTKLEAKQPSTKQEPK